MGTAVAERVGQGEYPLPDRDLGDPLRVIPSVSSLEYSLRGIASDAVDPAKLGRQPLRVWSKLLAQGMRARDRHPERAGQIVDLHFQEIASDPLGCIGKIYAHFGLELGAEARRRMQAYLDANPRGQHGIHRYDLASFGLDEEEVRSTFAAYCERFGVVTEPYR